jgi:transposase-like protein
MDNSEVKGAGRKHRKYSDSFRSKVAREYLEGHFTSRQLGIKYGIQYQRVTDWANQYLANIDKKKLTVLSPMTSEEQREYEALKKQVEALEKKLEYAQMKAKAFEIMIDLAKEELGIDLRKNSGAKQPGK